MTRRSACLFSAVVVTCAITVWSAAGQTLPREPHTFFSNHIGFTDTELRDMDHGRVITQGIGDRGENGGGGFRCGLDECLHRRLRALAT